MSIRFHEFCQEILGLTLTNGQEVIARIAFGGEQLSDLPIGLIPIAKEMLGFDETVKILKKHRRKIVLSLGRGSGKTTLCSAFGIYKAVTADLRRCGPGDVPRVFVIAPDKETAKLSIGMSREMIRNNQHLNALVTAEDKFSITIRRPSDRRLVMIQAVAASKGGVSARGRTIISFILDEAEFFNSGDSGEYAVNDREIYRALKPRLIYGGVGMLISTPWPTENMMAEDLEKNFGRPDTALAMIAPTTLVRDDQETLELVRQEMESDPENARREFFCERDAMVGGMFFDAVSVTNCTVPDLTLPANYNNLQRYVAAADFGFKSDSSALVIATYDGKKYVVADMLELQPEKGKPLKPSEVVKQFSARMKRFGVTSLITDGHYREAMREFLAAEGISVREAPGGVSGKHDTFARTKSQLTEGRCVIPENKRFKAQLLSVKSRPVQGGLLSISIPRRKGMGHGDLVSAWVLCVHDLTYASVKGLQIAYEPGTNEWKQEWERREREHLASANRDYVKQLERKTLARMSAKQRRDAGFVGALRR
jgi:hypothetical protein